jgi:Na+/melibiose symporter-like transporter
MELSSSNCVEMTQRAPRRSNQMGIDMLMGALITFLVVILVLYLINLLPLDGRAKQIARVVVIILGVISLLKYIAVF